VKKYEFELEEDRIPLYNILGQSFEILGNLINSQIVQENQSAFEIIYLVSKIFYISNQLYMCPFLTENNAIDPWIQFFKTLLDKPLPQELEAFVEEMNEIEMRDKHILWKIKGVAAKMTYRIFSKFGNPSHVEDT
jgi:hypothetical protein